MTIILQGYEICVYFLSSDSKYCGVLPESQNI
jgi:hypothetical protein